MKKKKAELVLPKIMLHFLMKFFSGTVKTYHKVKIISQNNNNV